MSFGGTCSKNKLPAREGPVIIYRLGGGGFGGGTNGFLGGQKGGSLKTLEGFRGGTTQILLGK